MRSTAQPLSFKLMIIACYGCCRVHNNGHTSAVWSTAAASLGMTKQTDNVDGESSTKWKADDDVQQAYLKLTFNLLTDILVLVIQTDLVNFWNWRKEKKY